MVILIKMLHSMLHGNSNSTGTGLGTAPAPVCGPERSLLNCDSSTVTKERSVK